MELSQTRPYGAQGEKPTHDFLSLYPTAQQDPTPSVPGGYLKTHDFLLPLKQVVKNVDQEVECIEKSPPTMVEHILPGGMGTYSISHSSYISQKVPKHEGIVISAAQSSSSNNNDENSNCSSYTESVFTLWEEPNVKMGKTRKENIAKTNHAMRDGGMKIGVPWMTSMEWPSQSSIHNYPTTTFNSLSSSHPSSAPKNLYFVDTVKTGISVQEEEDNDEEFVIKKEPAFHHKGAISVKVDTANPDLRPSSPRSKHSAIEQRRRSKINDRFSMLRGIIPHGDQKRDKASFLLEVIEYIQFLQEKVHKYEDSYQGRNNESPNITPLNNKPTNGFIDQPQLPKNNQNLLDSNTTSRDAIKNTNQYPEASRAQPQLSHSRSCTTDETLASEKLKDQELIIESGSISISSIYSQGLSSALTQALKSSGVDLSHANISVQVDLGKRSNTSIIDSSPPHNKEFETPSIGQSVARSRLASTYEEESGEGFKRLKTSRK